MISSSTEDEEDDVPFADPAIRIAFEAALGGFILAFNQVDYWLGRVVRREVQNRKVDHLYDPRAMFVRRLELLEALASCPQNTEIAALPLARLRAIATERNKLAHGHFDQNPFDGSYQLLMRQQEHEFPPEKIVALTRELDGISEKFRSVFYRGEFDVLDGDVK